MLKKSSGILLLVMLTSFNLFAQDIREIYVNLYTDSLKKGTFNYINIDGKLANGRYIPLDSNYLTFTSNYGSFYGNSLYIEKNCLVKKVSIYVTLKRNPSLHKSFEIWIKTQEDNAPLPTNQEILDRLKKEQQQSPQKRT